MPPADGRPMQGVGGGRLRRLRARVGGTPRKHLPPKPKRNLQAVLRQWHQRAGIAAFIFMGWLGISGFAINQSSSWGYDTVGVSWPWLTALYGLHAEPPQTGLLAATHWLAVAGGQTLLDGKPLSMPLRDPLGFVAATDEGHPALFIGTAQSLVLLTPEGERIDELTAPTLPLQTLQRVGTVKGIADSIAIQDSSASYQSKDGGENWAPVSPTAVAWSEPAPLQSQQRKLLEPYSRPKVTLEHALVDAHSGKLFGRFGVYVINTVGFLALWLSISGIWMTWRISRNRRRQQAR
ncbi:MAG: PepSY protein [Nevskia sp.]|nr:PepSY protein [Nevskia sp.]